MLSVSKFVSFKYQTPGPPGSSLSGPQGLRSSKGSKLVFGYVTVVIGTHLFLLVLNNSKVGRAVNFPPKMIEKVCVQHCSL